MLFKKYLPLTLALFSFSSYAQSNESPMLLGGDYQNSVQNQNQSLLIKSNDLGVSWQTAKLPLSHSGRALSNLLCNQSHCFATLSTWDSNYKILNSLFLYTLDQGTTWNEVSSSLHQGSFWINAMDCTGDLCMMANLEKNRLVTQVTHDNGYTWSSIETPANIVIKGNTSISCSDGTCYAVGAIYDATSHQMVSLKSDGFAWHVNPPISALFNDVDVVNNVGLSCQGKECVAINKSIKNTKEIFLMTTHDAGLSWHVQKTTEIEPYRLFCDTKKCLAVGVHQYEPTILISIDHGEHWKAASISSTMPRKGMALFFDLTCDGGVCIAVGDEAMHIPYIAISYDEGKTWQRVTTIRHLPKDATYLSSQSIVCKKNVCFIGAHFESPSQPRVRALLIRSTDHGKTWKGETRITTEIDQAPSSLLYVASREA